MINIFDKKTSYSEALRGNGLYNLDKLVITAETTEDISGNYELSMELELLGDVPTDLYDSIQVDNIIKVNDEYSEELFRIAQVNKGLDTIEIYARHITIADSLNLWLDNVKPTNLSGLAALQWLKERTTPKCNLLFKSNISSTNTADYVRRNLYSALFEEDNAFIKRWGGEVQRRGYTITIDDKIGADKSETIKIKESLNLTAFNGSSNIDEVSTVIYPVGFDGITAPPVKSPLINNYSMEFPIEIKYENVKVKKKPEEGQEEDPNAEGFDTLAEAQVELQRLAALEFSKNNIDKLQFTFDLDYVDLERFEEYKNLSYLQTADIGDTVTVRVDTFNMDIKARIIARKYDVLRGRRIENTLSTDGKQKKPEDIKDIIKDIVKQETDNQDIWEGLGPHIDDLIQQGFKKGYVVYEKNAVYAVDRLPKEKAKNVVVLNNGGLGHSSTGIKGPYKYGFTIDGSINASMITTGSLHGQYIGAGTIEANKLTVAAKNEIRDGMATKDQFINLKADVDGLSSTVGEVKKSVKGQDVKISNIQQTADKINLNVVTTMSEGNKIKNGVLKGEFTPIPWDVTPNASWGVNNGYSGFAPKNTGNADIHMISEKISVGLTGRTISISAKIMAEYNTKGAELYIIGSRTSTPAQHWTAGPMVFSPSSDYVVKSDSNLTIPSDISYIWVKIFHKGAKSLTGHYVYVDWVNLVSGPEPFNLYGLEFGGINGAMSNLEIKSNSITSTVQEVEKTVEGQKASISKIEQKANKIELSVEDKVGKDNIISSINLSSEGVKIKASKVEIKGDFITKSQLTDGTTIISGDNIQTGTLKSVLIEAPHITGKTQMYLEKGSIFSSDGEMNVKEFYGMPGGSFNVESAGLFAGNLTTKKELYTKGLGVIRRNDDQHVFLQIDKMSVKSGSASKYLEIAGYKSSLAYGVDLWLSDEQLKENIITLNEENAHRGTQKIGIDLIKAMNHYKFNFIGDEDTVECGYIAQDLVKNNTQLAIELPQQDGTTLLMPRTSFLIPNLSLAIQQQQEIIEKLEARIAALEAKQNV